MTRWWRTRTRDTSISESEEHVTAWRRLWNQRPDEVVTLAQVWGMASEWYAGDPRDSSWRRKTRDEAQAVFTSLGLTAPFWSLA